MQKLDTIFQRRLHKKEWWSFVYLKWCGPHMAGVSLHIPPNVVLEERKTEFFTRRTAIIGFLGVTFIYHPGRIRVQKNAFHRRAHDPLDF